MLKSLFSGVSGLQSHQVAMDVESNNIANVNTVGFKYSRANFSDLLAQTKAIATAPQGQLGGKNPVQVGLGSTVSSMTRIFSQGSIQNSDKNTDVAIQGDGLFIISPDGGNTYKYTRAGDFKFDAGGNFVDNNGYIVQGWLRDDDTGKVDPTANPMGDINIPPGLTTPASATNELTIKANLNSGLLVNNFSAAYAVNSGTPPSALIPPNYDGDAVDSNGHPISSGDLGVMVNDTGQAFSLQKPSAGGLGQGVWISFQESSKTNGVDAAGGAVELDITFDLDDSSNPNHPVHITTSGGVAGDTSEDNANRFARAINERSALTGVRAVVENTGVGTAKINLYNMNDSDTASHNINISAGGVNSGLDAAAATTEDMQSTAYRYRYDSTPSAAVGADKTFETISDLRYAMEQEARDFNSDGTSDATSGIEVVVNEQGKLEVRNLSGGDNYRVNLKVTAIVDSLTTENIYFTRNMEALNSNLAIGSGKAYSQAFNAATHASSIDVFDSLGSKHTLRTEFRKTGVDLGTGSTWDVKVSFEEPVTITNSLNPPFNTLGGEMRFGADGSYSGSTLDGGITFSANNGSTPDQPLAFNFGTTNSFDGMTSFDNPSGTSGISQDGYTGGDLVGIRIDQSGTLVGSFSNGRSFGLAQVGMAKFTNNEGLATEGGNVFIQTSNSGEPIIGTAATAGRGFIQSAALEASNVDLSRALTQLIIIQRGFQANGKTITTSDQLLETLIGLKR